MPAPPLPRPAPVRLRRGVMLWLAVTLLAAAAAYGLADLHGRRQTESLAQDRLSSLSQTFRTTIDRFAGLPALTAAAGPVTALLMTPANRDRQSAANRFLADTARAIGAQALFVMDASGLALASSNWAEPTTYVGHDYSFRPYFLDALASGRGRFFGVGVTTGLPGYFLAQQVPGPTPDRPLGVLVLKVDFSLLEAAWAGGDTTVLLSDGDGVVFLTSDPGLRYRALDRLAPQAAASLAAEQRYGGNRVGPLLDPARDLPPGARLSAAVDGTPWTLTVIAPWQNRGPLPAAAAGLTALAGLVLGLLAVVQRQRRARQQAERDTLTALEQRVQDRTADLTAATARLEAEIADRRRVDAELHRARDGLVQSAKLAAMGRAFSGLAHEVNQPLAALRTYLSSTRLLIDRGDSAAALANISTMDGAVARLSALTADLKHLSRRSDDRRQATDLATVASRVAGLLTFRLGDDGVTLTLDAPAPVWAAADAARMEQVVLNLLMNAIDAVQDLPATARRVILSVDEQAGQARICVADPGPGLPATAAEHLFEPFFTTKPVGLGLGLAICYGIVSDHGGTLSHDRISRPDGTAETRFTVALPALPPASRPPAALPPPPQKAPQKTPEKAPEQAPEQAQLSPDVEDAS